MKTIVAIEGQGYEADLNSIKVFSNLGAALLHHKKEYIQIHLPQTTNAQSDLEKLRIYESKLSKNKELAFEREGGFWLIIQEKEVST